MSKLLKVFFIATVSVLFVGCYNDYENPAPDKVYTLDDFKDCKYISIKDFKQLFYDQYGTGAGSVAKTLPIEENYVISGKVISSDKAGNVYKSLYIYDEVSDSAIELRLFVSNYVFYHPGQTIFVKTNGLVIGSYRYMLSVGFPPSDKELADGYANSNIENMVMVEQYVFPGAKTKLTPADTLVVNASNYQAKLTEDRLGCLVRFEGLTSKYGVYDTDTFPNYLETKYVGGASEATYTTKFYKDQKIPGTNQQMPNTWAYNYSNEKYYGSSLFVYGTMGYIVRVSGYANFALNPIPADAAVGDITAIYTKYSSRSGGFIKYQLLINSAADINF